jgi:hypothetical protein
MVCNESLQQYVMKSIVVQWYVMNHHTVCNENHSGSMVYNESLQRYVMKKHSSSMVCDESLQRYVMKDIVVQWYVMNHCNGML